MLFRFVCLLSILIALVEIAKCDKKLDLCEGIDNPAEYTLSRPADNISVIFRFGFDDDFIDNNKNVSVKLYYDFGNECLFFLEFGENYEDRKWTLEINDTHFDLRDPEKLKEMNHNIAYEGILLCGMGTDKVFDFTFSVNATSEEDKNAACNSFLAFESVLTLVSKSTGEEVIDDADTTDWTLIMIIICSVSVTAAGIAVFAAFLIRDNESDQ